MAAALALLIILPATAAPGTDTIGDSDAALTITVTTSGDTDTTAPTRLGRVTYLSNQPARQGTAAAGETPMGPGTAVQPANTVNLNVDFPSEADRNEYVKVRSSSGGSLTLAGFGESTTDSFRVITPGAIVPLDDSDPPVPSYQALEAVNGDTITITAGANVLRLTVDGAAPTYSSISPTHGTLQDRSDTTIGFIVTDNGAGLRTEAEDATTDIDGDGSRAEPFTRSDLAGAAVDINLTWDDNTNHERRGSRNWDEITKNKSYGISYGLAALTSKTYDWYVEAYDRVGNYSRTDANGSKTGDQDFELTVDNQAPIVHKRYAGIGFDPDANGGRGGEVKDASSILVIFVNNSNTNVDPLDRSTIDVDDFNVVGSDVVSVVHPNKKLAVNEQKIKTQTSVTVKTDDDLVGTTVIPTAVTAAEATGEFFAVESLDDANDGFEPLLNNYTLAVGDIIHNWPIPSAAAADDTCDSHTGYSMTDGRAITPTMANKWNASGCIDTRNRVYLVLSAPLDDDEEPEVQLRGGSLRDVAGNGNLSSETKAEDRISPSLTVTVSGDVDTDGRPLAQDDITVDISSGERIVGLPTVWLAEFDETSKTTSDFTVGSVQRNGTDAWTVEFGSNDDTKVAAIIVRGQDPDQNVGVSTGWKVAGAVVEGQTLDLAKLEAAGLLVEFDNNMDAADVEISPNPNEDGTPLETESMNPFLEMIFSEDTENTVVIPAVEAADGPPVVKAKDEERHNSYTDSKDNETDFDNYGEVTITAITVDGADVMERLARIDDGTFSLALSGLALGEHTLEYTAADTAGNEVEGEEDFDVLPRKPYKVSLRPGWNLVSIPANPGDPAIGSVLPDDHPATSVLAFQNGEWVSAVRDAETGAWVGTLTDIVAGYGYFLQSEAFSDLSTLIPEADPTTQLPVVPVTSGWNLLGVVDVGQESAGSKTVANDYFASIEWSVGYGFDTATNRWQKITKTNAQDPTPDMVENGRGYWVWGTEQGTLVP